jgi:hypothetical protein
MNGMDSPQTLLLGFSFSMDPDGSPGSYNEAIADAMRERIAKYSVGVNALLAAQWEIVDALANRHPDDKQPFEDKTFTFVAEPPKFKASDVLDAAHLVRLLREPKTDGARKLSEQLCECLRQVGHRPDSDARLLERAHLDGTRLAAYLNRLLSDSEMYKKFHSKVELHNLHRKDKGALGFEARQMPSSKGKLLKFQTMRVNRFIIEAVIPDERVLRRSTYLNTQGVLDNTLDHFKDKVQRITKVCVFGFPAHSPHCRRLTIESFWNKGISLKPQDVEDVPAGEPLWNPKTAQMWCRSCGTHEDYCNM